MKPVERKGWLVDTVQCPVGVLSCADGGVWFEGEIEEGKRTRGRKVRWVAEQEHVEIGERVYDVKARAVEVGDERGERKGERERY